MSKRRVVVRLGDETNEKILHTRPFTSMTATEHPPQATDRDFAISRIFAVPRDVVFKAWTEPERMKQWWGPCGFTSQACQLDLRPGGSMHYCLRSPEGREMWGKFNFREIVAPERLVYVSSFSDAGR